MVFFFAQSVIERIDDDRKPCRLQSVMVIRLAVVSHVERCAEMLSSLFWRNDIGIFISRSWFERHLQESESLGMQHTAQFLHSSFIVRYVLQYVRSDDDVKGITGETEMGNVLGPHGAPGILICTDISHMRMGFEKFRQYLFWCEVQHTGRQCGNHGFQVQIIKSMSFVGLALGANGIEPIITHGEVGCQEFFSCPSAIRALYWHMIS